jgi:hypothetical protein
MCEIFATGFSYKEISEVISEITSNRISLYENPGYSTHNGGQSSDHRAKCRKSDCSAAVPEGKSRRKNFAHARQMTLINPGGIYVWNGWALLYRTILF